MDNEFLLNMLLGLARPQPRTSAYSVDYNGLRFPTIVPGNESITGDIRQGRRPRLNEEQLFRALVSALTTGEFKQSSEPMSILGSEFDFPARPSGPRLEDLLGRYFGGGNFITSAIASPNRYPFSVNR